VIALNESYEVDEKLPGYFGIGSSGSSELLALHLGSPGVPVYRIPFIPLDAAEARMIAASFEEFVALIGRGAIPAPRPAGMKRSPVPAS
jgi:hypothetical protein